MKANEYNPDVNSTREKWVDIAKSIACILVVMGHLLQGLMYAGLIKNSYVLEYFNTTIYYFHVPVFFLCSGYLYQKKVITGFSSYINNIKWKCLCIIVPYLTFSFTTYLMKYILSNSVNSTLDKPFLYLVLLEPISPYWYLYVLLFLYLIFIPVKGKVANIVGGIVATLGFISLIILGEWTDTYIILQLCKYSLFFVAGMLIQKYNIAGRLTHWINAVSLVFIPLSLIFYGAADRWYVSLMGILGVWMTLFLSSIIAKYVKGKMIIAQNFLPIYVLHTICAAGIRIILCKIGITNSVVHLIFGVTFSFVVPILIAAVAKKVWFLEFFFYPRAGITMYKERQKK